MFTAILLVSSHNICQLLHDRCVYLRLPYIYGVCSGIFACWSFPITHPQLAEDVDCIVCPSGSYRAECSDGCGSDSGSGSGSGSASDESSGSASGLQFSDACPPCHSSCLECFGPMNDQCYQCTNFFLVLREPLASNRTNVSECDSFIGADPSQPILQCVDECPPGSGTVTGSLQCSCLQSKYQNGSKCLDCSSNCLTCVNGTESGCLTCSSYSYENGCVQECPTHTLPSDDNQCLPVHDP